MCYLGSGNHTHRQSGTSRDLDSRHPKQEAMNKESCLLLNL
ncbi:hypothetical protein ABLA30_21625 [Xenorhabdus nematophila]|nr:hypothetical protein [Xenorhabdus nematophila]